jgi:hypothetical protein
MRSTALLLAAATALTALGCGAGNQDGGTRADDPRNQNPNAQGIGPSGGAPAAPRDMPGAGRGSMGPHGKGAP